MITDTQKKILAHGIIEVDDWLARTIGSPFEHEIQYQLERLTPLYEAEKDDPNYKTAAEKAADMPI